MTARVADKDRNAAPCVMRSGHSQADVFHNYVPTSLEIDAGVAS